MTKVKWLALGVALAFGACAQEPKRTEGMFAGVPTSPTMIAAQPISVSGGGTGTFNADLDGDGEFDGSHFGFEVTLRAEGAALGHFMCQMAGNADFLGLTLMLVEGRVTSASLTNSAGAAFSGSGSVNLANGGVLRGVPFEVSVTAGGPGTGTLQLTVVGAFDGVPGDTLIGDGNFSLPVETVATGVISIH